ncbi:hypothetical protein B0T16DRAFT_415073 [Cercophora newfieldiana]|uniref:Uncharacterized protein n=1 Tax=Cercophora newfieldiana TaxID=92897 RepID=A0AA39XZ60_9PEZI|nr:hypothetical protein B0T16DRAFT_415073 [Cercophora newfieldiana]
MPRKIKAAKPKPSTTWAFPCPVAFDQLLKHGPDYIPSCCWPGQTWTTAAKVKEHLQKKHSKRYFCQKCWLEFPTSSGVDVLKRERECHEKDGPCVKAPSPPEHIIQIDDWESKKDPELGSRYPEVAFTRENEMLKNWLNINHALGFPLINNALQFRRPQPQTSAVTPRVNLMEAISMLPQPSIDDDDDVSLFSPYHPDLTPDQRSMQNQIHEREGGPAGLHQLPKPQLPGPQLLEPRPLEPGPNTVSDETTVVADTNSEVDSGTWVREAIEQWVSGGKTRDERLQRANDVTGLGSDLTRKELGTKP